MANAKKERDTSKDKLALANNGVFAEEYSSKWFVRVKNATRIDRIRFSFVKTGTAGKVFFEVYVTLSKILPMLYDMVSKPAYSKDYKAILTDGVRNVLLERSCGITEKGCYFYPSGVNGCRSLAVTPGNRPGSVLLTARGVQDGKGISTQIPIADPRLFFGDILHGVELVMGRTYVRPDSYEADILAAYEKKASEDSAYFASLSSEDITEETEEISPSEVEDKPEVLPDPEAKVSVKVVEPAKTEATKEEKKEDKKEKKPSVNIVFRTEGAFFESSGGKKGEPKPTKVKARIYSPETKTAEDCLSEIIFYDRQRKANADWYDRTVALASNGPCGIRVNVTPCGVTDGVKEFVFQKVVKWDNA